MGTRKYRRSPGPRIASQRGAVAIIVGLSLAVLVGFVGLALDGGHLYVTKTELQNASDACALAASYELTGAPEIPADAFERAEAAGKDVASRNKMGFQGTAIPFDAVQVSFGTTLDDGGLWSSAASATPDSKYVRCIIARTGIMPWFMQVLGIGEQTVNALATATLAPSQTNCGLPMAVCAPGGLPPTPGQWLTGHFGAGGGATGSFNWIDYSPNAGNEVPELLKGSGECSVSSTATVEAETGNLGASAAMAWNTRFGIYHSANGHTPAEATPDFTGYSYTRKNWPEANGPALPDFLAHRASHTPYSTPTEGTLADGNALTGLDIKNPYKPSTTATHQQYGGDRRLAVVPVVDCSGWGPSHEVNVTQWACILMLHPVASEGDELSVEYVGLANEPGNPCATTGVAGDEDSLGPKVPALVQ